MKRTKQINLATMRKTTSAKSVMLTGTLLIAGCGSSSQEAMIFNTVEQCIAENPNSNVECEKAYDSAVSEAERTAPKYNSQRACEMEFGYNQCARSQSNSGWFLPALGGFMVGRLIGGGYDYGRPSPLFGYRNSWVGADGTSYGGRSNRRINVSQETFKPKPTTARTITRGGFGSKIQAKSSWGSSRSRGYSFGG
jgi:uncharacterized protein YgiB involved in biofilm formation